MSLVNKINATLLSLANELKKSILPNKCFLLEVSPGELADRAIIDELKGELFRDESKRAMSALSGRILSRRFWDGAFAVFTDPQLPELSSTANDLYDKLRNVNTSLWHTEDQLRLCEQEQNFGDTFVNLARRVYILNDQRAKLKNQITSLLGSKRLEMKEHPNYESGHDQPAVSDHGGDQSPAAPAQPELIRHGTTLPVIPEDGQDFD